MVMNDRILHTFLFVLLVGCGVDEKASNGDAPLDKHVCGGIQGLECTEGQVCVDDPGDDCDPAKGGRDCSGICEAAPPKAEALFKIGFSSRDDLFIIKLTDADKIEAARKAIDKPASNAHSVMGIIVKEKVDYNPDWSFHLDPNSIDFFELAAEVCDSSSQHIEDNLDEVCGATLPDCRWCPWSSMVVAEVTESK